MKKRKIYHVIEVCQKMIKTFPKQGHEKVTFNAMFYRNGKRLNSIDQAVIENFSPLVRSYDKSENPDKVKVEFKDVESGTLIWAKTFEWTDVDEEIPKSLSGYAGLGEAEVNDLVQRKFSEMERSRELEFQVQDMQHSLEAKKQVEYYSNIIGMALPGLAKFFTNSPVGSAFNFLAGTDQEKSMEQSSDGTKDTQRETILEMIISFVQTLDNQELGTIYLMLSEIEKDRTNIQKILQFITGSTTVETPIQPN